MYGQTIAGNPILGTIVKEIPKKPVDMMFSFGIAPASIKGNAMLSNNISADSLDAGGNACFALRYGVAYNLRNIIKWRQTFATLSGTYAWGNVSISSKLGSDTIVSFSGLDFTLDFSKRYYFRRLALRPIGGLGYAIYSLQTKPNSTNEFNMLSQAVFGFNGGGTFEVALTPSVNIGLFGGGRFCFPVGNWTYTKYGSDGKEMSSDKNVTETTGKIEQKYSGLQTGLILTYCPTRSPFNIIIGAMNSVKRFAKYISKKYSRKN